jgi:hypothetical protein
MFFSEFLLTTGEILSFNYQLFRAARAEFHAATTATTTGIERKDGSLHIRSATLDNRDQFDQVNSIYDPLNRIKENLIDSTMCVTWRSRRNSFA